MIVNRIDKPVVCCGCGMDIEAPYIKWNLVDRTSLNLHPPCAKTLSHALYGHIQAFERKQAKQYQT
jgi:hypothetical protein